MHRPTGMRPTGMRPTGVAQIARWSLPAAVLLVATAWYFNQPAPPPATSGALHIQGSETMRPVVAACAEAFMARHPDADVIVRGGGTGDGVAALLHGMVEIGMASRPLSEREQAFAAARSMVLAPSDLALDAVAVIVHRNNPLTALDISALRRVFTGDLTQWQTLVPDRSGNVRALARAEGSGTAALFAERVLDGAAMPAAITRLTSNEAIVAEVAAQPDAIGYTGLAAIRGAGDRVRVVALRTGPDAVAVAPTLDTVRSAAYPLSRRLSLISVGAPQGIAAAFISHCAGPPGQDLLQRAGYAAVTAP